MKGEKLKVKFTLRLRPSHTLQSRDKGALRVNFLREGEDANQQRTLGNFGLPEV